ncbi:putative membrane protein [Rhodococcus sp. MTM3W5.2]|uniref:hypothetical protein n=1 Tax=Rhodococcus sp. MTM3W5.2 TaxID=1805827 RepID=UPI0009794B1B|nr:hypothetical protein [Rhodococcus sp. MTM3W5.2]AQA22935.1 putative membrane protein [Rhodococcus sp. MTM3W5.2]
MSVVYNVFVAIHLLGMAAIVGGYFAVLAEPRVSEVMVWGARIQFLTGLIIVGIGEGALDKEYITAKIATKLVLSLVVVALAEIGRAKQKRGEANPNLAHAAGVLAIITALIAALWT